MYNAGRTGLSLEEYFYLFYTYHILIHNLPVTFSGAGCALTGQQTEVIITHYFRDKLTIVQRIIRMAPSIGNCVIPILVGYLGTKYTGDVVVTIYAAILMQNSFFLASYTRPIYIEKVIKRTYNMLRDAVEDEDEVIFSNQISATEQGNTAATPVETNQPGTSQNEENDDSIVVFNSTKNAKEILDTSVQIREKTSSNARFSSDFSSMAFDAPNRFSSDFSTFEPRATGYQELENIDREQGPQPLYRETTVNSPTQSGLAYAINPDMTPGTARRTASFKKNLITLSNMLRDVNYYQYILLHLATTFSLTMLGVVLPPLIWEANQTLNIWNVSLYLCILHSAALSCIMMCLILPNSINEKARLCAGLCAISALGFYGEFIFLYSEE